MERFAFPIDLDPQPGGGFTVTFPDVPEAITQGEDEADALVQGADCLSEAIAARITQGLDIPRASAARGRPSVCPEALIAAKAALFQVARAEALNLEQLARRLKVARTEAKRLLDPRHGTKIERLEAALARFGKRIEITVRDAA